MPGDCERCVPVPMDGYPGWSRCSRCKTTVCWATHNAYEQEGRWVRWPASMPATP
jgi:hypothetical protein